MFIQMLPMHRSGPKITKFNRAQTPSSASDWISVLARSSP